MFESPYGFEVHELSPVVLSEGEDAMYTAVPSVLIVDGTWYMFYSGRRDRRTVEVARLATSSDGLLWEKHPGPMLKRSDGQGVSWLFVAAQDDGWAMYYTTSFSVGFRDIFKATAPDLTGPWSEVPGIAIQAPFNGWNERVIPTGLTLIDGTYWMPYAGFDRARENPSIGFFTSSDGETWETSEEPIMTGTPGEWDAFGVVPANIIVTDRGWELFYLGFGRDVAINSDPSFETLKMARLLSTDGGATWIEDNGGLPVLDTGEKGWPGVASVALDDAYFLYGGHNLGFDGVFLVTGRIAK